MGQKYIHQVVHSGNYVEYSLNVKPFIVPDGNGVKGETTFYPAKVKMWRVLQNEMNVVELVPIESAGRLTLYGVDGWRNSQQILQQICERYGGSFASRTIGGTYLDMTIPMETIRTACREDKMLSFSDHGYVADISQMQNGGGAPGRISWIASRLVERLENGGYALKLRVSLGANVGEALMAELDKEGNVLKEYENTFDVCPAVIMPYNAIVDDGCGSFGNPYWIMMTDIFLPKKSY